MLDAIKEDIKNHSGKNQQSLKFLYAEVERASLKQPLNAEKFWVLVEKLIADNNNLIKQIGDGNPEKVKELTDENVLFSAYLPKYMSKQDVERVLFEENLSDLVGSKDPKNIGLINKILKGKNLVFKNDTVKNLVMGEENG